MKKIFIIIFIFSNFLTFADNYPTGSREAGMGNADVTLHDVWSVQNNQAGLALVDKMAIGFHFENKYITPTLGLKALAYALPTSQGTFGVDITYFGYSNYNESKIGLAYARKFSDYLSIGVQLDYLNYFIADSYGNKGTAVAEIGILSNPIDKLSFGVHIFNPTLAQVADYNNERIPTIVRFGLGYEFSDKFLMTAETEKDIDFKSRYKIGLEYFIVDNLALRTGILTNPFENSFGVGYVKNKISVDLAFTNNKILGITPHVSFQYIFN